MRTERGADLAVGLIATARLEPRVTVAALSAAAGRALARAMARAAALEALAALALVAAMAALAPQSENGPSLPFQMLVPR